MRINPIIYGGLVLTVFFGIILGFQAGGIWSISGKVDASGAAIAPSAGNVDTIKGWMTLEQIAIAFNVPLPSLLAQFDLPADTSPATAIKDLESDTFDTTALRTWLESLSVPANEPQSDVATQVVLPSATPAPTAADVPTPVPTEHTAPDKTITGKTTFQELLDWGVPIENIRTVIEGDLPLPSTGIKDFVTGKGLEFSAVKTQLQAEVDKTK